MGAWSRYIISCPVRVWAVEGVGGGGEVCVCVCVCAGWRLPGNNKEEEARCWCWNNTLHFIQFYFSGHLLVLNVEFAAMGKSYYTRRGLK